MNLMHYFDWKSSLTRNAEDGTGGGQAAPPSDPPAGDLPAADSPPAEADYSFLPEAFRGDDGPDIDGFKAHFESLEAAQAQMEERQANIPEDADGYDFTIPEIDYEAMGLPKDFKLEVSSDDEDLAPLLKEMGGVLHQHGVPKDAAPALMGILAKYEAMAHVRGERQASEAMKKEAEALGSKAEARISTVQRNLEQRLPETQAKALMGHLTTADGVKALETLLSPRGLGGADPKPKPRDPDADLRAYYANPS